ncbi:MAG TPA: NfeD family protein [Thermoplasmata archaeon]|nr:NfeD family protein [Thermoplasmata archaeon]
MTGVNDSIGIAIVIVGLALLVFELVHPGALLIIPASILLVAGFLYLFLPNVLLNSVEGPVIVVVAAILGALIEVPYYRWVAPVHRPMSTTSGGLVGEEAIVVTPVEPNNIRGKVKVKSEIWSARSDKPIPVGTRVRVVHGEGVSVTVQPIDSPPAN